MINNKEEVDADLKQLKANALSFPEPVKSLILSEPDSLPLKEYIIKQAQWEKLLRMK